ncbi:MAG TPA: Fe-S protein assembly chaperone HscA [Polyangia bacterium]|nr:Fe-S protein assembly chaperone HscA [Polyangia bacterium]
MAEAFLQISEPGASPTKRACQTRAIGIDLGTTNSLVAIVDGGRPVCLRDAGGAAIVPSVVHYAADGSIVVGTEAHDRLAPEFPRDTIASVKRFMGRGPSDAEATRKLTPYQFAPPAGDGNVVRFAVASGRPVTPMEVSAEILKVLKARAESELGSPLDGAVITVPAYFDDGQRQATRDAGRLAGLEVLRLLNEPTAAAIAYGLDKQAEGTFAVFDLGGGTFDVSILKLEDGVFEVKATGGDSALGGDDFDRAIAGALLAQWNLEEAAAHDARLIRRVLDGARAVKERLTSESEVSIDFALPDGKRTAKLTRTEMELLVEPVLMRCAAPVRRALKDAGIEPAALSGVILVGGATRMPLVRQFVEKMFHRPPLADIDPDEVVALGAAVQADVLAGGAGQGDMLLLDVVPLSLGLETMGGVVEKIIHRNTTVPCGATQTFTTFADKQTGFDLHVVQGERELADQGRSLARFTLKGIPPMPAGMARLEVTFMVDADGILRVSAREETTGQEAKIEVKPSYGLTDEEVERMLLDSFAHAEEDVKVRLLTEQQVEADRIAAAARAAMADTPELLTAEDQTAIEAALGALAAARAGTDHLAIRAAVEALDAASKEFAGRRMNVAFERGLRGKDVATVEKKADETAPKRDLATRAGSHAGHSH